MFEIPQIISTSFDSGLFLEKNVILRMQLGYWEINLAQYYMSQIMIYVYVCVCMCVCVCVCVCVYVWWGVCERYWKGKGNI